MENIVLIQLDPSYARRKMMERMMSVVQGSGSTWSPALISTSVRRVSPALMVRSVSTLREDISVNLSKLSTRTTRVQWGSR